MVLLLGVVVPIHIQAQDKIGEIVRPATGAGRAIYAPMDQAVILPRFRGSWASRSSKCAKPDTKENIALQQRRANIEGIPLSVATALVEFDSQGTVDERTPRARDYANAADLLIGFSRPNGGDPRYIHFRFSSSDGRLIVEEVGKPRRAYVRCP